MAPTNFTLVFNRKIFLSKRDHALCVLGAEGFGYLLANVISVGHVCGISLLKSPSQLVNGHFVDDFFLTLIEEEDNVQATLQCLDTFCLALGSASQ